MIGKKKGLCLRLLVLLLGAGSMIQVLEAYTVQIKNDTPYEIGYYIGLGAITKDKRGILGPGDITKFDTHAPLTSVKAKVYRPGRSTVKAKGYFFKPRDYRMGDQSYVVSGSDKTGYTVFYREKRSGKLIR